MSSLPGRLESSQNFDSLMARYAEVRKVSRVGGGWGVLSLIKRARLYRLPIRARIAPTRESGKFLYIRFLLKVRFRCSLSSPRATLPDNNCNETRRGERGVPLISHDD